MTEQNVRELAEYSRREYPEEVRIACERAERLCQNTFLFDRRWDMEPTDRPVAFDGPIQWDHVENGDLEWAVMLARQSYLYDVALAWLTTGEQKYIDCWKRLVEEFIDNCPFDPSPRCHSWRTLDVGIRATVWVRTTQWLEPLGVLDAELLRKIEKSLVQHFEYLYSCMDNYHLLSNWGVLANSGAVWAGVWLRDRGLSGYAEKLPVLMERLARQIELQVLDDGMHWEQSPMYHHEVLWCYLELLMLNLKKTLNPDPILIEKTQLMCYATLGDAKPNHHQTIRGDSDDTDVRDVLTMGAYLFKDARLKAGAYKKPDLENVWRMGMDGVKEYEALQTMPLSELGGSFPHSGNYYFKAGSKETSSWVHFRCGPLGSGHGHADLLHLDVTAGGVDILTDSGRWTYVNDERRTGLKASDSHNTFRIDGEDFTDCCASWRFGEIAKPIKGEYREDQRFGYVSGMHLGYIHKGLAVRREVVFIKPGLLVVFDSFFGPGMHECCQTFHFGEGETKLLENGASFKKAGVNARIQTFARDAKCQLKKHPYSPFYNQMEQRDCLSVTSDFENGGGILTVIGFDACEEFEAEKIPVTRAIEGTILPDEDAQAVEIRTNNHRWTVMFSRKEIIGKVNMLCAKDCRGYGEAMVFDDQDKPTVLSW